MTNTEIQVGEYVRTNNGSIFKIIGGNVDDYLIDVDYHDLQKIENDIYDELMWLNYNDNGNFIRRIVKNHSFNLIDLIKVGDYVNGHQVFGFCKVGDTRCYLHVDDYECSGLGRSIYPEDIKTIVTKEQFKSMEYKVGGDNDK